MDINLDLLQRKVLTEMVNAVQPSFSIITRGVYGTLPAQDRGSDIYEYKVKEREILYSRFAPENTSALPVGEGTGKLRTAKIPHQPIKTSLNPSDVFRERGLRFYDEEDPRTVQRAQEIINERVLEIVDQHTARFDHTFEWMGVQAMRGMLEYSIHGQDSFQADYQRPASHEVVLSGTALWTDAASNPAVNIRTAQKAINAATGIPASSVIAICDSTAAAAFTQNDEVLATLDNRNVRAGVLDLTQGYGDAGTLGYLGTFAGCAFWELDNSMTVAGTSYPYIRPGYVEFVAVDSRAEARQVFAPITDFDMVAPNYGSGAMVLQGATSNRRLSKAFGLPDPSTTWIVSKTSTMPEIKRPGFSFSMKVV